MTIPIPDTHHDLLVTGIHAVLATLMPDGQPQSSIVWVDYDGQYVLLNTALERQKGRNMQANPAVSLLIIDPENDSRWIEIRGKVVAITAEGAEIHADKLTRLYTGKQHFYGDVYTAERKFTETRVIVKIEPIKISLNAYFS